MTTQQMGYFLELANCLNFSEAASRLYLSQSTLSRQISSMESELGVLLFTRNAHTVQLTAAGQFLKLKLGDISTDYASAVCDAQKIALGTNDHLTLAIADDQALLPSVTRVLRCMKTENPKLKIQLEESGGMTILEKLRSRQIDCALVLPHLISDRNCSFLPLTEEAVYLAANEELLRDMPDHITQSEFYRAVPWDLQIFVTAVDVFPDSMHNSLRSTLDKYAGVQKNITYTLGSLYSVVVAGLGATLVNSSHKLSDHKNIRMISIAHTEPTAMIEKGIIYANNQSNPSLKRFLELLIQETACGR